MTYTRVESGHARLLKLAMDVDFPDLIEKWKKELDQGRMTSEMREVFAALGYPVPRRSTRTQAAELPDEVAAVVENDGDLRIPPDISPLRLTDEEDAKEA